MVMISMGVSGCGKATVANKLTGKLAWSFYDADNFHPAENIAGMSQGAPLTDEDRSAWFSALAKLATGALQTNQLAGLACSALKQKYRQQLIDDPTRVRFVYLKNSQTMLLQRMQPRSSHFMALEEPVDALTLNAALEPAEIVERVIAELLPPDAGEDISQQ